MSKGRLFTLTYDANEIKRDELQHLVHSLETIIDGHDQLLVLPDMMHLKQTSTEELLELAMLIDNILESRRSVDE